jgi:RNA polymerase sigma factor (sigma-70 family)
VQALRLHRARHSRLPDERLAELVSRGDGAAFEELYDRHHLALLAFCRHMVGSREDAEDALQQAFVRAHGALAAGRLPDAVRPWLFAIARNRCRTLLGARRETALPEPDAEPSFDGFADHVSRRADLRELVADLARLPSEQRDALVLAELGDLGHAEIATVIGCPPPKVKALIFQARTTLIAERDARAIPCDEIRSQLDIARAGVLRRGPLRKHLRQCRPCDAYRHAVARQREKLALLLPVAPASLKAAVLGAAGASGGAAAGSATGLFAGGLVAKVAVTAVVAAGGGAAVDAAIERETPAPRAGLQAATAPAAGAAERGGAATGRELEPVPARPAPVEPVSAEPPVPRLAAGTPPRAAVLQRLARRPRARAFVRRRLARRPRAIARRLVRAGVPPRVVRRALRRRARARALPDADTPRLLIRDGSTPDGNGDAPRLGVRARSLPGAVRPRLRDRERTLPEGDAGTPRPRRRGPVNQPDAPQAPAAEPAPAATAEPAATAAPTVTPEPTGTAAPSTTPQPAETPEP